MRRWLMLAAVCGIAGPAIFSGTEPFTEHVKAYQGEAQLYAALGRAEPDQQLAAQFADAPGAFSGTFASTSARRRRC